MCSLGRIRLERLASFEILGEVEHAVARWRALGMSEVEIDAFGPAFEHTEREAARRA
jgi:hypothetical protein